MCVIVGLPKGIMLPFEKLKNAALNNADGYGIIVTNDKRMEVFKKVNPKGNDPEDVQKLLEQFKEHDRYLHLRYATAGKVNNENAHPFTVFNRDDHRIEFMHNGTISDYRPSVGSDESDTFKFASEFLSPLLERLKEIDPEDPFISTLIESRMGAMSRGLLISTHSGPTFLGKWKAIDREQSHRRSKYDNSYRGSSYGHGHGGGGQSVIPFQGNKAPANDGGGTTKTTNAANTKTSAESIVDIATVNKGTLSKGREISPKEFEDYLDTGEATLTDEAITWFAYLSTHETTKFATEKPEIFALLFENVVARFADLFAERMELEDNLSTAEEKHKKASVMISAMKHKIEELEGQLGNGVANVA
jgi:hypothetical protein